MLYSNLKHAATGDGCDVEIILTMVCIITWCIYSVKYYHIPPHLNLLGFGNTWIPPYFPFAAMWVMVEWLEGRRFPSLRSLPFFMQTLNAHERFIVFVKGLLHGFSSSILQAWVPSQNLNFIQDRGSWRDKKAHKTASTAKPKLYPGGIKLKLDFSSLGDILPNSGSYLFFLPTF